MTRSPGSSRDGAVPAPLDGGTVVVHARDAATSQVDQDLVILNLRRDSYVALDAIGRRIWESMESPRRVDDLCLQLCREFQGDPEQITANVLAFLDELAREELLHVVAGRSA